MGRNALYWPFTIGSVWNQPIGSGATYVNANLQPRTGSAISLEKIYINMDPTQPAIPPYQNSGQSSAGRPYATSPIKNVLSSGLPGTEVPFNPNLIIKAANANDPSVLIGSDGTSTGGTRYEFGNTYHGTAGSYTGTTPAQSGTPTAGVLTAGHGNAYGTIIDAGLTGGSGGSNITTLGGTIRYGEFTNGTDGSTTGSVGSTTFPAILHAFRFNLQGSPTPHTTGSGGDLASPSSTGDSTVKGWRWPATHADGNYNTSGQNNYYGGTVKDSVEGSLYAIPQSVDLTTLGLSTVPGKQLAWTLQNFGAYVCNNTVVSTWAWAVESSYPATASGSTPAAGDVDAEFTALYGYGITASSSSSSAWANDVKKLLAALYVVSNNSATNIGGGGTPLQPLAPAIGGSSGGGTILQSGTTWTATQSGTTNTSLAMPSNAVVVGDTVVVQFAGKPSLTGVSLSDSLGNTYIQVTGATATQSTLHSEVWWCLDIVNAGSSVLTWSWTGAGCASATANRWANVNALDIAVVANTGSGTSITSGASVVTVSSNDLVIAAVGQSGAPTLSAQAFSPAGTAFHVPDTSAQSTGASNNFSQMSETLAGSSGATQSFSATSSVSSGWTCILMCFTASSSSVLPSAPSGLTATATGTSGQVTVGWTAPSVVGTGITDYKVQYSSTLATLEANGGTVIDTSSTSTSHTVTGLTNGTLYYFGALAVNGTGSGPYSSAGSSGVYASATPSTTPAAPSAPIAPTIDSQGPTDAVCDWGPNPPNPGTQPIELYTLTIINVGTSATVATFTVNDTNGPAGGPSLTYDATGLPTSVLLGAYVAATNSVGTSSASATTDFTLNPTVASQDSTHLYFVNPAIAPLVPTVRIGFQANPSYAGSFVLGTSILGGTDTLASFVMTDVSQYVTETLVSSRGRSRETDQYSAGTLTFILRNENRDFDPTNAASPFAPGILPRAPVQIELGGQRIFTGYVSDFGVGYIMPGVSTVSVPCVDAFGILAMNTLNNYQASVETSDQRIADVLNQPSVSYPGATHLDLGVNLLQASTQNGVDALSHCQTGAASEGGLLFTDRLGVIQFKNQTYIPGIYAIWPNGILAFSDNATDLAGGAIGYTNVSMLSAVTLLFNQVQGTRTGGATQQVDQLASEKQYLIRCLSLPTLECADDATVLSLCNIYLQRYAFPRTRFDSIEITLNGLTPAQYAAVIALDLGNAVQVTRTPPGGGSPIVQLCMIERVDWSCDATQPSYKVTFGLSNLTDQIYFILGSPTQGVLGQNKLF